MITFRYKTKPRGYVAIEATGVSLKCINTDGSEAPGKLSAEIQATVVPRPLSMEEVGACKKVPFPLKLREPCIWSIFCRKPLTK